MTISLLNTFSLQEAIAPLLLR